MAHEAYIGNESGLSRNVSKIYLGDNSGVSRKVKRGYIGDSDGKARLFFFSGYIWNRYNLITSSYVGFSPMRTLTTTLVNLSTFDGTSSKSSNLYSTQTKISDFIKWVENHESYEFGPGLGDGDSHRVYQGCGIAFTSNRNQGPIYPGTNPHVYKNLSTTNDDYVYVYQTGTDQWQIRAFGRNRIQEGIIRRIYNYSQGSYIDQVESDNPSAYPDNGRSGNYWYVKVTQ